MADGQTLTTSGAGATTITGLSADLTDTTTAAQNITVGSPATITLALGTDTAGTDVIVGTALTDGEVVTLTGANDATLSLVAGDVTASSYTGALAVTATTGTNVITTGTGADTIIGGDAADSITGGTGVDIIKWIATDDGDMATESGAAAGDTDFSAGSAGDKVVGFVSGTDKLHFAAAMVTNAIGTEADTLLTIAAAGTVTNAARFVEITTAFDGTTGDAIIDLNALTTSAVAIGDSFVAFMNDGTSGYLFLVEQVSTADTIDADDITLIGQITGITDVADGDFVSF
jgi:Ca2+-binding RTX toxin-like protein